VSIGYSIPAGPPRYVEIKVYNVRGQAVRALVDAIQDAGGHEVLWDGEDETGRRVASGTYFYRMKAGTFEATRKIVRTR
jgi:flagellar hook assembly protein FlgD